jgi:hypothetical protein
VAARYDIGIGLADGRRWRRPIRVTGIEAVFLPSKERFEAGGVLCVRAGCRRMSIVRETSMRTLALAILAVAAVSATPSARAQTYDPKYPVCLQVYQGWNDYYFECGYTSLAQCNMSASGRAAQCIVNPYYAGPKAAPGRRDRRNRRVY